MTSKPRKDKARTRETHIYLTEKDYADVAKLAAQESRSVNGQILHLVRQGLSLHLVKQSLVGKPA